VPTSRLQESRLITSRPEHDREEVKFLFTPSYRPEGRMDFLTLWKAKRGASGVLTGICRGSHYDRGQRGPWRKKYRNDVGRRKNVFRKGEQRTRRGFKNKARQNQGARKRNLRKKGSLLKRESNLSFTQKGVTTGFWRKQEAALLDEIMKESEIGASQGRIGGLFQFPSRKQHRSRTGVHVDEA